MLILFTANMANSAATIHVRLARNDGSSDTAIDVADSGSGANQPRSSVALRTASSPYAYELANLDSIFLDSPKTTSEITYKVQATAGATYNKTVYMNRPTTLSDSDLIARTSSSITVMEIGV